MHINRKELLLQLQWAQRFVDRKTTIPILANVLFSADGNTLTLTGTDLEIAGVTTLAGRTRSRFDVAVPAKQLIKYLQKLDTEEVDLSTNPAHHLVVTAGRDKLTVLGMSRDSYPELPTPPADGPVAVLGSFAQAVSRVGFAISCEQDRFALNGALLDATDTNEAVLVATDGHRLSLTPLAYRGPEKLRMLIPKLAMNEAARLDGDITLQGDRPPVQKNGEQPPAGHLYLTSGTRRIVARKLTGNFPDYERVLGRTDWPNHVFLPAKTTERVLDRVALCADERSRCVRLAITEGELRISSSLHESGYTQSTLPVAPGEIAAPLEAGYNAQYLIDFLRAHGGDQAVAFCWTNEKEMGLLATEDGWLYGVMPQRI
jgi:DNA polymerase-3 subunit beta